MSAPTKRRPFTNLCPRVLQLATRATPSVKFELLSVDDRGITGYLLDGPLAGMAAFYPWPAIDGLYWDVNG